MFLHSSFCFFVYYNNLGVQVDLHRVLQQVQGADDPAGAQPGRQETGLQGGAREDHSGWLSSTPSHSFLLFLLRFFHTVCFQIRVRTRDGYLSPLNRYDAIIDTCFGTV